MPAKKKTSKKKSSKKATKPQRDPEHEVYLANIAQEELDNEDDEMVE